MPKSLTDSIIIATKNSTKKKKFVSEDQGSNYTNEFLANILSLIEDDISKNSEYDLRKLPLLSSTEERLQLLGSVAMLLRHKKGRPVEAFQLLEYALLENPTDEKTLERLEALADKIGNWEQLCTTATQAMEMLSSREDKAELCLKIGDWCNVKLDRSDCAVLYYQYVLDFDADNIPALNRLSQLYRDNEQWEDLSIALATTAEKTENPAEQIELLIEAGNLLQDKIGNVESAISCFNRALEVDSRYEPAWDALHQIYLKHGLFGNSIDLLKNRLMVTSDKEQVIDLHLQIAEIQMNFTDDLNGAQEELRSILDLDPDHLPALRSLERVYIQCNKPESAEKVLVKQLDLADTVVKKIELLERLAAVFENSSHDLERVSAIWEKVLAIDPKHGTAIEKLANIYEQGQRWEDLAAVLRHKIGADPSAPNAIHTWANLGKLYEIELDEQKQAKKSYKQALSLDSENVAALEGLARVYEAAQNWKSVNKTLKSLIDIVDDPEQKIAYLNRIGNILSKQMRRPQSAIEYFEKALSYDDTHLPTLEALRSVYIKLEDWKGAIRILTSELDLTESAEDKAALMVKMGRFCENISRGEDSIYWYQKAAELNPDDLSAKLALATVLLDAQKHKEAEPLLTELANKSRSQTDAEKYYIFLHLAMVRQMIGKEAESLEPARVAVEIDNTSAAAMAIYAKALVATGRLQEAQDTYKQLLHSHVNEISNSDVWQFVYLLGDISAKLGLRPQAIQYFLKLLNEKEDHPEALNKVIELSEIEKDFETSLKYRKKLDRLLDGKEKAKNLAGMGDICAERLANSNAALDCYLQALKITPNDRALLHKLIPVYESTEQWNLLVDTLYKIASLEKEPEKLARYYYSIGIILRDKMGDPDGALKCFTKALDHNCNDKTSLDALVELLTKLEDYKTLERCLRQVVYRLHEAGEGESNRALQVWHTLGEVYRVRLGDYNAAAMAHQRISLAKPDDLKHRELVAACKFQLPEKADEAIEEYRNLITRDPDNADYYRPLGNMLSSLGRYDEAWCVSAALYSMGKANSEERAFYESNCLAEPIFLKSRLDEQMMQQLKHPDDKARISEVFGIVLPVLLKKAGEPLRHYGVTKSSARIKKSNRPIADLFYYAADFLGLEEPPKLYFKKKEQLGFTYMRTDPPASLCGELYSQDLSLNELLFLAANHLSYYRHGCLLPRLMPSDLELKSLLIAAMKLGNPVFQHPKGATQVVSRQSNALERLLNEIQKADLQDAANLFIATNTPPSIRKWRAGIEYTASRAAMLLTGDLVVAAQAVRSAGKQLGQLSVSKKIADLKSFSVSQEYAELRRTLGMSLNKKQIKKLSKKKRWGRE